MRIVDEPAERIQAQLQEREIEVRREPYDPKSRDLLSDFVGFLRSPQPGTTVTLFEDEDGRVRYYTVARTDPEVAALKAELARVDVLERKVARVDELAAKVEKLPELEAKVEKLPALEAKVEKLPALESSLGELRALRTRLERLERPSAPER